MPQGLERYGLTDNPFRYGPLDPVQRPEDADMLIAAVDGFKELSVFATRIEEDVANGEPSFFLVLGRTGAGRTSVANHLLACYREIRGAPAERFAYVLEDELDHNALVLMKKMTIHVCNAIKPTRFGVRRELIGELRDTQRDAQADTAAAELSGVMADVSQELNASDPPAALGLVIEDVPHYKVLRAVMDVFKDTTAIVVFTVQDYKSVHTDVLNPYRDHVGPDRAWRTTLELHDIAGAEVTKLVLHRWKAALEDPDSDKDPPFVNNAIEVALGNKARSVARIMSVMRDVLEDASKIGDGKPWPEDRSLAFTPEGLSQKVGEIDRQRY
jgi:hypothetical protein